MPGFLAEALTWEENRHYISVLKSARSWSVPPRTMILGVEEGWTYEDRLLAQALTILEEETCKGCGVAMWHSRSSHRNIEIQIEKDVCYGCKSLEEDRAKQEKSRKAARYGEKQYAKAVPYDEDEGLPSRFDSYQREAQKKERAEQRRRQ